MAIEVMPITQDSSSRTTQVQDLIHRNVLWSLGAGVIPLPLVDVAAITTVQLKMVREMSSIYGVKFSEGVAKKIAYTLISSLGVVGLGGLLGGSLAKLIPVVGQALGVLSTPVIAGAVTYSLGRILMMHFESGGTLLDFDPQAMREHFKLEFEKAKQTVTQLHNETGKPARSS